jgi:hypothetical protein
MTSENFPSAVGQALNELCRAYRDKTFEPVLEADIAGYLYYILVKQNAGNSSSIHLSGRIPAKEGKRKYPDLVIGDVWHISEQARAYEQWVQSEDTKISVPRSQALIMVRSKGFQERLKPMTATVEVAIEIKPFLRGFSSQQLWQRLKNTRADLEALATRVSAKVRILIIFDELGYLVKASLKTRLEQLIELRDSLNSDIRIVYASCTVSHGCDWKLV